MSKKSVLEKLKKQIMSFGEDTNKKIPSRAGKYDWSFAPVITDGKANIGFKKAFLDSEEALGKGVQGPIDPRTNYKYQWVSPDGRIQRTVVTNGEGERYSIAPWGGVNTSDVELDGMRKNRPVKSGWGKDISGNWYRMEDADIPLAEAREMKHNWSRAFEGVDMRGKMDETRKPGPYEVERMKSKVRNLNRNADGDMLGESKDFPGETRLMVKNKKDLYSVQTADAAKVRDEAQRVAEMQSESLQKQIADLQKKISELENQKNQLRPYSVGEDVYEAAVTNNPYRDYRAAYTIHFNPQSYKK